MDRNNGGALGEAKPEGLLVRAPYVVTMANKGETLSDAGVLIQGRNIAKILTGERADALARSGVETLNLKNAILTPGLINLHAHCAMSLFRGFADDLRLMEWLNDNIWPLERKHVGLEFVVHGSLIAMGEMLLGGVTTVNDMYFFHAGVCKAAALLGIRAGIGCSIMEFANGYAKDADDFLKKALDTEVPFMGEERLKFILAPHAPYTVSDETFRKVLAAAEKYDMLIHCHIHETQDEIDQSVEQYGVRPLERLDRLGILSDRLIAAHMTRLTDEEIALAKDRGVSVAHNPASNMKLASGFCRTRDLLKAGVNVGVGTDGAASNNKQDMFSELRLASLIAKGSTGDPLALGAYETLEMGTINGAKAMHWDKLIGSIEEGKRADLIAVDCGSLGARPLFDPVSHLVYAADRSDVTDVWVSGERVVEGRRLTRVPEGYIEGIADVWQERLSADKAARCAASGPKSDSQRGSA